jgi:UDP-N-acetylglucosamine 2-epimerase (non-hydrolysing)
MKPLFIFGTRPEALKLVLLIKQFKSPVVCVTGQHKEMLYQALRLFNVKPHYDLNVMKKDQTLFSITANILLKIEKILEKEKPDVVVVQGDTTSAMAGALAAFYKKIPVAHVEAGLRTYNKYAPFPEEINRKLVTPIADVFFAPTKETAANLRREAVPGNSIFMTGNTSIDSLLFMVKKLKKEDKARQAYFKNEFGLTFNKKMILVTGHRRENFGRGFKNICYALKDIAKNNNALIVYPVHLNPNVQKPVKEILSGISNLKLIPPMDYENFVYLMLKSHFIITDSGGVQEEAPSLKKPVLVMREVTERKEGVSAGNSILVGTDRKKIVKLATELLKTGALYKKMTAKKNPYGDGQASIRIRNVLNRKF